MVSFNPKANTIDLTEDTTIYKLGPNQTLVKVSSVPEEYIYMKQLYPEFETIEQRLIQVDIGDRVIPVDLLHIKTNDGEKTLYFDISETFNKYNTQPAQDTDYDRIYKIFRDALAKNLQKIRPEAELPQADAKKLFIDIIRGQTDNELIKSGKYPDKESIPSQVSDNALKSFIDMAKSPNKSAADKIKISKLLAIINTLDFVLNTPTEQSINNKTDYKILTDFLCTTMHKRQIDDIAVRKYIKYYCDIHIDHVIQNFLPAKMFNDITGGRHDWSMTKNMILSEVIKNLQTANKHLTVGDFYKDIFLMTAPFGLNESELPKIRPSEASKQILSDLCNPQLVHQYLNKKNTKSHQADMSGFWVIVLICVLLLIIANL